MGKTRIGAEQTIDWAKEPGTRIALVAKAPADARDVMVKGESGIEARSRPDFMPLYEPSKRLLTWPNRSEAHIYSAETPDALRGPQHHKAWVDEFAKFKYPRDTWDNLMMGLRLGDNPQVCMTTTPRPLPVLKEILDDPSTVITRGSTYSNAANLPGKFLAQLKRKYEGTRLGRQELYGEVITEVEGALWKLDQIDRLRLSAEKKLPDLVKIVIALDPAVTNTEDSDEFGIIAAGLGANGDGYVLLDASGRYSPAEWGEKAVTHYLMLQANEIVAEANNGGDMIEHTVQTAAEAMRAGAVPFRKVHASRGKHTRAEPISALYEQGRVHHVGCFPELEDEMCNWVPGMASPNRMDALVWALTHLMIDNPILTGAFDLGNAGDSYWRY